jgi:hypothetical protein
MRATFISLMLLATVSYGQTVRIRKASPTYDVEVSPGDCGVDSKCGPLSIVLLRKGSRNPFQILTAGRIPKSDVPTSVQFVDLNFDGLRDLLVFDGLEVPSGYGTEAQRIYLYSKKNERFEFNAALSEISHRESLAALGPDKNQRLIYTHARLGGGVFQMRGYRFFENQPVLTYEVVTDATFRDGTKTKVTTRKLINGRWRSWTKTHTGPLNR